MMMSSHPHRRRVAEEEPRAATAAKGNRWQAPPTRQQSSTNTAAATSRTASSSKRVSSMHSNPPSSAAGAVGSVGWRAESANSRRQLRKDMEYSAVAVPPPTKRTLSFGGESSREKGDDLRRKGTSSARPTGSMTANSFYDSPQSATRSATDRQKTVSAPSPRGARGVDMSTPFSIHYGHVAENKDGDESAVVDHRQTKFFSSTHVSVDSSDAGEPWVAGSKRRTSPQPEHNRSLENGAAEAGLLLTNTSGASGGGGGGSSAEKNKQRGSPNNTATGSVYTQLLLSKEVDLLTQRLRELRTTNVELRDKYDDACKQLASREEELEMLLVAQEQERLRWQQQIAELESRVQDRVDEAVAKATAHLPPSMFMDQSGGNGGVMDTPSSSSPLQQQTNEHADTTSPPEMNNRQQRSAFDTTAPDGAAHNNALSVSAPSSPTSPSLGQLQAHHPHSTPAAKAYVAALEQDRDKLSAEHTATSDALLNTKTALSELQSKYDALLHEKQRRDEENRKDVENGAPSNDADESSAPPPPPPPTSPPPTQPLEQPQVDTTPTPKKQVAAASNTVSAEAAPDFVTKEAAEIRDTTSSLQRLLEEVQRLTTKPADGETNTPEARSRGGSPPLPAMKPIPSPPLTTPKSAQTSAPATPTTALRHEIRDLKEGQMALQQQLFIAVQALTQREAELSAKNPRASSPATPPQTRPTTGSFSVTSTTTTPKQKEEHNKHQPTSGNRERSVVSMASVSPSTANDGSPPPPLQPPPSAAMDPSTTTTTSITSQHPPPHQQPTVGVYQEQSLADIPVVESTVFGAATFRGNSVSLGHPAGSAGTSPMLGAVPAVHDEGSTAPEGTHIVEDRGMQKKGKHRRHKHKRRRHHHRHDSDDTDDSSSLLSVGSSSDAFSSSSLDTEEEAERRREKKRREKKRREKERRRRGKTEGDAQDDHHRHRHRHRHNHKTEIENEVPGSPPPPPQQPPAAALGATTHAASSLALEQERIMRPGVSSGGASVGLGSPVDPNPVTPPFNATTAGAETVTSSSAAALPQHAPTTTTGGTISDMMISMPQSATAAPAAATSSAVGGVGTPLSPTTQWVEQETQQHQQQQRAALAPPAATPTQYERAQWAEWERRNATTGAMAPSKQLVAPPTNVEVTAVANGVNQRSGSGGQTGEPQTVTASSGQQQQQGSSQQEQVRSTSQTSTSSRFGLHRSNTSPLRSKSMEASVPVGTTPTTVPVSDTTTQDATANARAPPSAIPHGVSPPKSTYQQPQRSHTMPYGGSPGNAGGSGGRAPRVPMSRPQQQQAAGGVPAGNGASPQGYGLDINPNGNNNVFQQPQVDNAAPPLQTRRGVSGDTDQQLQNYNNGATGNGNPQGPSQLNPTKRPATANQPATTGSMPLNQGPPRPQQPPGTPAQQQGPSATPLKPALRTTSLISPAQTPGQPMKPPSEWGGGGGDPAAGGAPGSSPSANGVQQSSALVSAASAPALMGGGGSASSTPIAAMNIKQKAKKREPRF